MEGNLFVTVSSGSFAHVVVYSFFKSQPGVHPGTIIILSVDSVFVLAF